MFDLSFEYPYVFLSIFAFILSSIFFKVKSASYYFPHLKIFKKEETYINNFEPFFKYTAIIFAIIALASPIKTSSIQNDSKNGINIILSLDTSSSMRAIGFNPNNLEQNRWQAVSKIVQSFIKKRVNDNIGLVVFGSSVMIASPLSFDKNAQSEIINYLDIGILGDKTAMIDSLASSINILKNQNAKSNIIVLLTDGEDTNSQIPLSVVIKLANKYNIKIYTIGIGESNKILLDSISNQTNAQSFQANSTNDLKSIYQQINSLESSKIKNNNIIFKEYYYFYALFISILALIGYIFCINKDS